MSEHNGTASRFIPRKETPLHAIRQASAESDSGAVNVSEQGDRAHIILRGDTASSGFKEGVARVLGAELPTVGQTAESDIATLYWMGPDEWLAVIKANVIADPAAGPVAELRRETSGHVSIVDVSSGQSLLALQGPGVMELLQRASVYDFHISSFEPGRCTQTTFAKATALVRRIDEQDFELVVRRSFIDYVASWIKDACSESGCSISGT